MAKKINNTFTNEELLKYYEKMFLIRKFEEIGTHPCPNKIAIGDALTFHQGIGSKNKEQRLIYLRDRWAKRLLKNDRIKLHTSLKPGKSCAIATVEIKGIDTSAVAKELWDKYRIFVVAINHDEFTGCRVTPHVYTIRGVFNMSLRMPCLKNSYLAPLSI